MRDWIVFSRGAAYDPSRSMGASHGGEGIPLRITNRGQYAVAAMVDLARHQRRGPVSLAAIAQRQFISPSYLEQLFRGLRENGLVRSVRGPAGGYLLERDPIDISIAEIIQAVDEPIRITRCSHPMRGCHHGRRCSTHFLWEMLGECIDRFLESVSLAEAAEQKLDLKRIEASIKTLFVAKEGEKIARLS